MNRVAESAGGPGVGQFVHKDTGVEQHGEDHCQNDAAAARLAEVGSPQVRDQEHAEDAAEGHRHREPGDVETQTAFTHTLQRTCGDTLLDCDHKCAGPTVR